VVYSLVYKNLAHYDHYQEAWRGFVKALQVMMNTMLLMMATFVGHALSYKPPHHWPFRDLEMSRNPLKVPRRTDCVIVVELWEAMGKKTTLTTSKVGSRGCCRTKRVRSNPDIPGVLCNGDSVIKM